MNTSHLSDEEGPLVKSSEHYTSLLSDEKGPLVKTREQNTSRLRDGMNPHVEEMRKHLTLEKMREHLAKQSIMKTPHAGEDEKST